MDTDTNTPGAAAKRRRRSNGPAKPQPKLKDVAAMAAVSTATVSRVFNAPTSVREELRERVLQAAERLAYTPNPAAKALRMRKSHMVGAVIPTLDYAIFARVLNAFAEVLGRAGYTVVFATSGWDNSKVPASARVLVERGVEALLLVGLVEDPAFAAFLREKDVPVVTTYSLATGGPFPAIGIDNFAATHQIVDYLIRLGHRRIAMLAGPTSGNERQQERIAAYRAAMTAARQQDGILILERSHKIADGAEALRKLHAEHPEVTAVVCNSDVLAFGVLSECKRLDVAVPAALSVTGFDDSELASYADPPLTTVAVPGQEMGQRAAEAILGALTSGRPIATQRIGTNLILRGSTGLPRQSP